MESKPHFAQAIHLVPGVLRSSSAIHRSKELFTLFMISLRSRKGPACLPSRGEVVIIVTRAGVSIHTDLGESRACDRLNITLTTSWGWTAALRFLLRWVETFSISNTLTLSQEYPFVGRK